jgi:hypothetical protein
MSTLFLRSILLICLASTVSCDPVVVEIEIPDKSARMTINTYFIADSSWRIGITRAQHVLDPEYEFEDISDAVVNIFEDSQLLTTLSYIPPDARWHEEHGVYASDKAAAVLPKPGKTYEIRAHSDQHGDVSAFCTMPSSVPVAEVIVNSRDLDDNSMIPLTVLFNDPPDEENFYELYVRTTSVFTDPANNISQQYSTESPVYTLDPLFYQKSESFDFLDASGKPFPVLFSDDGFDGRLLRINCKASVYPFSTSPSQKIYYEIIVRALSKEYYQYIVTRKLQQAARRDPFAQPVKIYSNVENGFGIFAAYNQSAMVFE